MKETEKDLSIQEESYLWGIDLGGTQNRGYNNWRKIWKHYNSRKSSY